MKRDIEGIHIVNSYHGKKLNKRIEDATRSPIQYIEEEDDIDFDEEMSNLFNDLGDSLIHLLIGDINEDDLIEEDLEHQEDEDSEEDNEGKQSSSSRTNTKENESTTTKSFDTDIFHIFNGICTKIVAEKAMRLFLMYRLISKNELGKYIYLIINVLII